MKCLVLAAGEGVRMKPLTNNIPKPLIKVNGNCFIHYLMKNISSAGIKEIGLVVHYKKEKMIKWAKNSEFNIEIISQKECLGTGDAVRSAEKWLGNENFIVLMGDNLYSFRDISNICKNDSFCYVGGIAHKNPELFGVLVNNGGSLERIVEKPKDRLGNLINTGLYKFTPKIFGALKKIKKSDSGEYYLTDAVSLLCKEQLVKVKILEDYWINFGTIKDIPVVEKFVRKTFE